jgi:hypothetical protein
MSRYFASQCIHTSHIVIHSFWYYKSPSLSSSNPNPNLTQNHTLRPGAILHTYTVRKPTSGTEPYSTKAHIQTSTDYTKTSPQTNLAKMCNLQSTTYACGHTRKTLHTPCPLALTLGPVAPTRAPSYCLNGLPIVSTTTSPSHCGRSTSSPSSPFTCSELAMLSPLTSLHSATKSEMSDYAERVRLVEKYFTLGKRPEYDWAGVDHHVDVQELKRHQNLYWGLSLPAQIRRIHTLFAAVELEFSNAYALAVNGMAGREVLAVSAELTTDVESDLTMDVDAGDSEAGEVQMFGQVCEVLRGRVREEVLILEDLALVACLDGVGWVLPVHDVDTVQVLMGRVETRDVKPLYNAVEAVEWEEVKMEKVCVVEEMLVDPLDVAPMEDVWC